MIGFGHFLDEFARKMRNMYVCISVCLYECMCVSMYVQFFLAPKVATKVKRAREIKRSGGGGWCSFGFFTFAISVVFGFQC